MTTEELGTLIRTPLGTLKYWRHVGTGPRPIKVGRRVLYERREVDAWLESAAAEVR